ncbi:potassium transporter Kef [Desulfosarcina alkanivorans]|uniref:Potassium transporter Kef n=1 Tax=Desulfosarcina alkanivorans TaxID=571177 RepID=A0A5K7YI26_9BACT|nr:cation:proton antiporter family protein [Desulfosarcina alkanivorans]BBO67529.1 potassium transporter Kef [Desulfosarcina alkanivorans]
MDPVLIVAAFILGALSSRVGLPPLVGYLVAGFVLNSLGVAAGDQLETIADAGVTLLLFSVGLKLKLKNLASPEVWAGATLHMLITVAAFGLGIGLLGMAGLPAMGGLDWKLCLLIAFALSFSSTVFAVKVFEEKREMASRHAVTAIGILIMQDLIAVVFLAVSSGKTPSIWAPFWIGALFLLRPLLLRFMSRCGHGELLMLFGILLPAAGYGSFELVGLKGDLGALVFGMLVAGHPKTSELAQALLSFKDLFLVGFFLNIGISGAPSLAAVGIALLLALVMPLKAALFFGLLTRFKLRARTSLLSSLSLANYSEFGLIVGAIGVANGWIGSDWLVILAIALSCTFIMAAPANSFAHAIYARWADPLKRFQIAERLPDEVPLDPGDAKIAVIGLGGIGSAAYDEMRRRYGNVVVGVDFCEESVAAHLEHGRRVVLGDASDSDFWARTDPATTRIDLVMLTLPDPKASVFAIGQMKDRGYAGQITASVRYEDEVAELKQAGIDAAYVVYEEAGVGFADHVCKHVDHRYLQDAGLTS